MKKCLFCAEEIQDDAVKCRYCGEFLDGRTGTSAKTGGRRQYWVYGYGFEYRSELKLFGIPLVHVATGVNPETGRPRVAKGIIAIGNIALGIVALGGIALGGLVLSGIGLGLLVFGGIAIGGVAFGGVAVALYLAVGGLAISAKYAIGGLALAPHTIDSTGVDPELLEKLKKWWPGIQRVFRRWM